MFSVPATPLATLLLLVASSPALAGMDCTATTVYIDQTPEAVRGVHSVCVSAGLTTTISFSEKLKPGSVRLKEAKRFVEVAPGNSTLVLVPPLDMRPGEVFSLKAAYGKEDAPHEVTLELVGDSTRANARVVVSWTERPINSYKQQAEQAEQRLEECQQDKERLQAACNVPVGLAALRLAGHVDFEVGVKGSRVRPFSASPRNALTVTEVLLAMALGRVAVEVGVKNPAPEPWTVSGGALECPRGTELKLVALGHGEPIVQAKKGQYVVAEAEAPREWPRAACRLTLWDESRKRTVAVDNLRFSDLLPEAAAAPDEQQP